MAEETIIAPRLPSDLERLIFEIVALSNPTHIPSLVRVAWRAKHWVEPMLYRILIVTPDRRQFSGFHPSWEHSPGSNCKKTLRFFSVLRPASLSARACTGARCIRLRVKRALEVCTGITTLQRICPHAAPAPPRGPQLRALSLSVISEGSTSPIRSSATSRNITHLEVMTSPGDLFLKLAALPRIFTIQCVVFLPQQDMISPLSELGYLDALRKDDWIVVLDAERTTTRDLIRGTAGGDDYWTRADALIAARRTGTVEHKSLSRLSLSLAAAASIRTLFANI
ncbi:hypothetical protein B0H16DRAFT_1687996 [Mycena metata]|uniref:Uncharacterized protein n=1 Tax=Mycena metata TaxID=1033252 RepID=A0AAD7JFY2_9AGAR|nr:hypothetical protein B0H16DRAFT_1687996 [Mycena metata]